MMASSPGPRAKFNVAWLALPPGTQATLGASGFAFRWTFYVGIDGRIIYIDKQVRAGSHGSDIAARLRELGIS